MIMKRIAAAFVALFTLSMVAACQVPGTSHVLVAPTVEGASVQQNAYAVLATYAEVVEEVAAIVENPETPDTVKTILATAALNTEGPAMAVKDAFQQYDRKQSEIQALRDAGQPIPELLLTQAADLYFTAKKLWQDNQERLTQFPGLVQAVKSAS